MFTYIEQFKTTGDHYTHVISNKKYLVQSNLKFNELYCKYVLTKPNALDVYESNEYRPFLIELKFNNNKNVDDYICLIINQLNDLFQQYYEVDSNILITYVVEYESIIRITYPNISIRTHNKNVLLRKLSYDSDIMQMSAPKLVKMFNRKFNILHIYVVSNVGIYDIWVPGNKITNRTVIHFVSQLSIHKTNPKLTIRKLESFDMFMRRYQVKAGMQFTHTSMIGGSWNIPDWAMNDFYYIYSKEVMSGRELCLTEKHIPKFGPIIIDMDFKFSKKPKQRLINKELIKKIVDELTKILKTIFCDNLKYDCFVLQRPGMYEKQNKYCDGLHIQFPYVVCDYEYHRELRSQFIETFKFDIGCDNKIEDVYDMAVISRNNWCMFLSTKRNIKPYEVVRILNSKRTLKDYSVLGLIKLLSIRNKIYESIAIPLKGKEIKRDLEVSIGQKVKEPTENGNIEKIVAQMEMSKDQILTEQIIRKLLNILDKKRVDDYEEWIKVGLILHHCSVKNGDDGINYFKLWDMWSSKSQKYDKKECEKQWKSFKDNREKPLTIASLFYFAKCDNPKAYHESRIDEYLSQKKEVFPDNNLAVTKVINKGHSCYAELNDAYCPFIKGRHDKNPKTMYLEVTGCGMCLKCKECPFEMLPMNGHVKIPNQTLFSVFGIDNMYNNITINNNYDSRNILETFAIHKAEYNVFEDQILNELVYLSLNGTGYKIAELVYYLCKDMFRCTSTHMWYEYAQHKWNMGAKDSLFNLISSEIAKYHLRLYEYYDKLKPMGEEEHHQNEFMKQVISDMIKKLETTSFKNSIMEELCSTFYLKHRKFEKELDQRPFLIGFENGVYDLEKFEFRDGVPEDHITLSVGYDYSHEYTRHKKDVVQFLTDILPNEDDRIFLLKYISTGLCGWNYDEIAVILSGKTRNGKTKLKELIDLTLGQYFVTFASNLLTTPLPPPNSPVTELMSFKNKRFAMGSEPEADSKINSGFYKFLTGNETIVGRELFESKTSFKPSHKLAILCNNIPAFDNNEDKAVWKRTKCVEFPVTFVDNPTLPNEKMIDKTIGEKLKYWKNDFMLLLIEYFKLFKKDGLNETPNIAKFTMIYRETNDIFLQFLEECTEKSDRHIHTSTLYEAFKNWFVGNNPRTKIPSNRIFVAGLKNYHSIEPVRVDTKTTTGIKNLKLINKDAVDVEI
jgi:P4 family phage/plasmid primase-like protien